VYPFAVLLLNKVSRVFAANLLMKAASESESDVMDSVYLMTTDADLWPISSSAYDLPAAVDLLSLNSFCCGNFTHGTETYRMIPMANIGARIATWRNLTDRYYSQPFSALPGARSEVSGTNFF